MRADVKPISLNKVEIQDDFWTRFSDLIRREVIPYQWKAINDQVSDAPKSHAIHNLKIAGNLAQGEFHGCVFQDSDVYKWLEAAGYSLATHSDPKLEALADSIVDIIAQAQQPDGYINSCFTISKPDKRWTNLRDWHELYCAGHFFEAAASYFKATGNKKILELACRFADYIQQVFGDNPDQIPGYPGHEEIELALVKLYQVTNDQRYLNLSKFFIDKRGQKPHYFDIESDKRCEKPVHDYRYHQAHLPVREQTMAEGHAVRAMYLYAGLADIAYYTHDKDLFETCLRLWENVVNRRMYITGGIGSSAHLECFTFDYDLPNNTAYTETCASIGLIFWAHRMLKLQQKSEYADILELALFNGVISGMSLDGKRFFYVNPLEVWPEAVEKRFDHSHVRVTRQSWFGCACCPPNLARLLASLGSYVYAIVNDCELYTHLYIGGSAVVEIDGKQFVIKQNSRLPWEGKVNLEFDLPSEMEFTLALRMPAWCHRPIVKVNDTVVDIHGVTQDGYAKIQRTWNINDRIELDFPMEVKKIRANPKVRNNRGKVALKRGPIVYCLEQADNGGNLHSLMLSKGGEVKVTYNKQLLNGVSVIIADGMREIDNWEDVLYKADFQEEMIRTKLLFIPYFAWANRESGEMLVWVRSC